MTVVRLEDEWYEDVPDPAAVIEALRANPNVGADIFTFWQRLPDVEPKYDFHTESEHIAVLPITDHDAWFNQQIKSRVRTSIRKAEKEGLVVRETNLRRCVRPRHDGHLQRVRRSGRAGRSGTTARISRRSRRQFSRYLDREIMIGAYYQGEMIGFVMLGDAGRFGLTGQIISSLNHRDKATNIVLMSAAVEACASRGLSSLVYLFWSDDSLSEFKRRCGFEKVQVPRYYVPLTWKGTLALRSGAHRGWRNMVPTEHQGAAQAASPPVVRAAECVTSVVPPRAAAGGRSSGEIMAGIAGVISRQRPEQCRAIVGSMIASMTQRRTDVSGIHADPEMSVWVGWVSHNDSGRIERGDTVQTADVALIVADGPVSPFAAAPALPSPASLLERLRREGESAFAHFNGLHSGVLVDRTTRRTLVFNDPHGLDRIYYGETRHGLYFASEAKALLQAVPEFRALNAEGVADQIAFGCVLGGRTLFRGIWSLPAGSLSVYENGRRREQRYLRYEDLERLEPMSPADFDAAFDEAFQATIREQFQAPAKIGLSLTGGVDSRLILAYKPEISSETVCYTFAGENGDMRDVRVAAAVASACGLPHETIRIERDFFDDFGAFADRTVLATDGSFGLSGAHELYFNEKARALAPIRLGGVFGGELLRGVSMLQRQSLARPLLDSTFLKEVVGAEAQWRVGAGHPITNAAFTETPWSMFGTLAACRSQVTLRAPYLDNRIVSLAYRSPGGYRRSPMWALELIGRKCAALAGLPTDRGFADGKSALSMLPPRIWSEITFKLDYLVTERLSPALAFMDPTLDRLQRQHVVLGQHKYLNYRRWFRDRLAGYVSDRLASVRAPWWDGRVLRTLAEAHISGRANYVKEISTVLTLDAVERLLVNVDRVSVDRTACDGVAC